jgi:hypothetical protein
VFVFLLSAVIPYYNYGSENHAKKGVRDEWKTYLTTRVIPVMKPYREQFETTLSDDEKMQIEQIRNTITSALTTRKEAGLSDGRIALRTHSLTDEQINVWKQTREQIYQALLKAAVIAENHRIDLDRISIKEQQNRSQWAGDMWLIFAKNHPWLSRRKSAALKENKQRLMPVEHLDKVVFVIWNPQKELHF